MSGVRVQVPSEGEMALEDAVTHVHQDGVHAWKMDQKKKGHNGQKGAGSCLIITCPTHAKIEFMPGKWTEKSHNGQKGAISCLIIIRPTYAKIESVPGNWTEQKVTMGKMGQFYALSYAPRTPRLSSCLENGLKKRPQGAVHHAIS